MMKVKEILQLPLQSINDVSFNQDIQDVYIGDLLSFVMGKAKKGQLWLTVQAHPNVIAIASLLELSGVIVLEGVKIPEETIQLAKEHKIALMQTNSSAVEMIQALLSLS